MAPSRCLTKQWSVTPCPTWPKRYSKYVICTHGRAAYSLKRPRGARGSNMLALVLVCIEHGSCPIQINKPAANTKATQNCAPESCCHHLQCRQWPAGKENLLAQNKLLCSRCHTFMKLGVLKKDSQARLIDTQTVHEQHTAHMCKPQSENLASQAFQPRHFNHNKGIDNVP